MQGEKGMEVRYQNNS